MNLYKITIQLEEPVTAGYRAVVSNEIRSLDYLPGTALRGALFEALRLRGLDGKLAEKWFGEEGPRWTGAWRRGTVAMPRSFQQVKRDKGFGGIHGVWNALSVGERPSTHEGMELAWQDCRGWLKLDERGKPLGITTTAREVEMHAGLRYDGQSVRGSALFSRQAMAAGLELEAYVSARPEGVEELGEEFEMAIGKRRTVGGLARVKFAKVSAEAWVGEALREGEAIVQLMTPALVPGAKGGWRRGLDEKALREVAGSDMGVDLEIVESEGTGPCARSRWEWVTGWNGNWQLPREQAVAISAGSCWRIRSKDSKGLEAWLKKVEEEGLGVRTKEGFGWVAVNPAWQVGTLEKQNKQGGGGGAATGAGPGEWPGLEGVKRATVEAWMGLAHKYGKAFGKKHVPVLYDARAALQQRRDAEALLGAKTDREAWVDVHKLVQDGGWPGDHRNGQLFVLAAVITLLEAKDLEGRAKG